MNGGQQVLGAVINIVLAAIVGPRDYGIVAIASVYILFMQMLLQQGMATAIVQRKTLTKQHLDSAFWLVMTTSCGLTVVSIALAGWWAGVNHTPALRSVIIALSVLIPVNGLVVVQEGLMIRKMRFRALAIRTNVAVLAGGISGLVLAVRGYGVWSLVAQWLATDIVALVVLWSVSGWRPGLRFSRVAARELLGFSVNVFLSALGGFANNRADALFIGIFFGPAAVGLYRLAARLIETLVSLAVRPLQTVALPELSRYQDEPDKLTERALHVLRLAGLLAIPILGIVAATADQIMAVVGKEWAPAADALRILCVVGAVRVIMLFNGLLLQAIGKPGFLAVLSWTQAILSGLAFVGAGLALGNSATSTQVAGMAASRAALYGLVFTAMNAWILARAGGIGPLRFARVLTPTTLAAAAAFAFGGAVELLRITLAPPVIALGVKGCIVAVGALAVLTAIDGEFRSQTARIWSTIRGRSPSVPRKDYAPEADRLIPGADEMHESAVIDPP